MSGIHRVVGITKSTPYYIPYLLYLWYRREKISNYFWGFFVLLFFIFYVHTHRHRYRDTEINKRSTNKKSKNHHYVFISCTCVYDEIQIVEQVFLSCTFTGTAFRLDWLREGGCGEGRGGGG